MELYRTCIYVYEYDYVGGGRKWTSVAELGGGDNMTIFKEVILGENWKIVMNNVICENVTIGMEIGRGHK